MRVLLLSFLLVLNLTGFSQLPQLNLVPWPAEVKQDSGYYLLRSEATVVFDVPRQNQARLFNYLQDELKKLGINLKINKAGGPSDIQFIMARMPTSGKPAYSLFVDRKGIIIASNFEEPAFNGIQTLLQLIPSENKTKKIPFVKINDHARFEYRGMHLDVCRHFFSVSYVKRYIDYLAYHKMNKFHWHLTEDQGWRIEIKKYPELTKIGAWRNGTIIGRYPGTGSDNIPYGGFYTQEEIKDVIRYASDRFVEVIPEVDVPGHTSAAIAAYPWLSCFPSKPTFIPANMISKKSVEELKNGRTKLVQETWGVFDDVLCAGNDSTFKFLENVLDEVITLFPSKYVHMGGDECPKTHWKQCPKCQQRIKDLGLKDEHGLQSYFVQRIEKYLNSKGKTLIGWNEILEGGLAPNAVVMSWQGESGGIEAAKQDHYVIMTPQNPLYFDHTQSEQEDSIVFGGYNPLEKVYAYDPIPAVLNEKQSKFILGAQANLWAEYITNTKKIEYQLFPRMSALSEVLWTPKEKKDWKRFEQMIPSLLKRYEWSNINYSKAYFALKATVIPESNFRGLRVKVKSPVKNCFLYDRVSPIGFTKELSLADLYAYPFNDSVIVTIPQRNSFYSAILVDGPDQSKSKELSRIYLSLFFNKATGKRITLTEPSNSYPGDGPFTLVNGIQNNKGFVRSKEFLGWLGKDCEAIIDLGSQQSVDTVIVHSLDRRTSWIYRPASIMVQVSEDGKDFWTVSESTDFKMTDSTTYNGITTLSFPAVNARYVKITVRNWGTIPDGMPGAGTKAWLFVDEIEIW